MRKLMEYTKDRHKNQKYKLRSEEHCFMNRHPVIIVGCWNNNYITQRFYRFKLLENQA